MDGRQNQFLQALRQITEEVSSEHDLYKAMALLVHRVRQTTAVDCCSLYLSDELRKCYKLLATDGLSQQAVGTAALKFGEGLVGEVGSSREVLNLADAPSHPSFKYLPDIGEDEYRSFLGVPIINQGQLLGVLDIQSTSKQQFGDQEESFMITLAAQIGSFIARYKQENSVEDDVLQRIKGQASSGNLAIAKALVLRPNISISEVKIQKCEDPMLQVELFHQAIFQLQVEMDRAALKMQEQSQNSAVSGYLSGYGRLVDDSSFQDEVDNLIEQESYTATSAVKLVIEKRLAESDSPELSSDLKDFAHSLTSRLVHASNSYEFDFAEPVILIMDSLPSSMLAELKTEKVLGFVTCSPESSSNHANILARDLNIPAVFGAPLNLNTIDGHIVVVDGRNCEVILDPPESVVSEFKELMTQNQEQLELFAQERNQSVVALDGAHINIFLNSGLNTSLIRSESDQQEMGNEIDGIGLYRTEIAFMMCQSFPTEQQQYEWYSKLLGNYAPKPVCMRTLDIGSDKGLSYLPIKEANPALGWRGVRVTNDLPQILHTQLMAMMRAHQKYGNLEIMVPMVSSLNEIRSVKSAIIEVANELRCKSGQEVTLPRFGVMVEVPALTYLMDEMASEVDFFSIGSNDLIQYMLAVDRSNQKVNQFYDCFHPSIVRCLSWLLHKANEYHKKISVCGEMAGDPLGAMLLVSLGYTDLSMNYSDLLQIKYALRRISVEQLRALGSKALELSEAAQIKALYKAYAVEQGLGKLIALNEQSTLSAKTIDSIK